MKTTLILFLSAALMVITARAQDKVTHPAPPKPLTAEYTIYSGWLGEEMAPTPGDRKLSIEVTGQGAKDIFESIGPDVPGVSCTGDERERLRRKGRVWCAHSPTDGGRYKCYLGFNLRTGESIAGGSC
jgi:hypothetical protein